MDGKNRLRWQRFWWHPIFGPVLPVAMIIGLVIGSGYLFAQ
jgi:hypothetical protein